MEFWPSTTDTVQGTSAKKVPETIPTSKPRSKPKPKPITQPRVPSPTRAPPTEQCVPVGPRSLCWYFDAATGILIATKDVVMYILSICFSWLDQCDSCDVPTCSASSPKTKPKPSCKLKVKCEPEIGIQTDSLIFTNETVSKATSHCVPTLERSTQSTRYLPSSRQTQTVYEMIKNQYPSMDHHNVIHNNNRQMVYNVQVNPQPAVHSGLKQQQPVKDLKMSKNASTTVKNHQPHRKEQSTATVITAVNGNTSNLRNHQSQSVEQSTTGTATTNRLKDEHNVKVYKDALRRELSSKHILADDPKYSTMVSLKNQTPPREAHKAISATIEIPENNASHNHNKSCGPREPVRNSCNSKGNSIQASGQSRSKSPRTIKTGYVNSKPEDISYDFNANVSLLSPQPQFFIPMGSQPQQTSCPTTASSQCRPNHHPFTISVPPSQFPNHDHQHPHVSDFATPVYAIQMIPAATNNFNHQNPIIDSPVVTTENSSRNSSGYSGYETDDEGSQSSEEERRQRRARNQSREKRHTRNQRYQSRDRNNSANSSSSDC